MHHATSLVTHATGSFGGLLRTRRVRQSTVFWYPQQHEESRSQSSINRMHMLTLLLQSTLEFDFSPGNCTRSHVDSVRPLPPHSVFVPNPLTHLLSHVPSMLLPLCM